MKKLLAVLLVLVMAFSIASCGKKPAEDVVTKTPEVTATPEATETPEVTPEATDEATAAPKETPETKPTNKPADKPASAPENKPTNAPTAAPTQTPTQAPEAPKTAGNILLADFKAKAASASSALSLAESLSTNSIIQFMAGAMPVEPGYLSGFDNVEITGFKEGAVFMPMIGSIPFIGYVFVLEDGANVSDFIQTLKSNANLRWNICVEAEEMVTGSVGNKVFFVMCNKDLSAE